ncbi:hypothetical protein GGR57DRAFT_498096 [Xylariaceae sp. FL1272]|nr:hypothetical protein GGR57DRAFT_498096 [Xylariaceae sp. FL1272]
MGNILSRSKPQALPAVATDTVIPLHHMDDNNINRQMVLMFMMRFDDVLDPQLLKTSLEKLLSRDDWRKLGARLRLNENGKLDYHIPESFDEKRPAFAFSRVVHDVEIGNHPLASRLPKASAKPAVLGDPEEFKSLMRRKDGPTCIEDYLYRDEPQLSMHVVCFEDATLVSLGWPHTFLDAMGRRELFQAWIAVLEGRDDDVKPLHGVYEDPLKSFGLAPKEQYILADRVVAGWNKVVFIARFIFELMWHSQEETRIVCLPAAHAQKLRAMAIADLETLYEGEESKPFLSEGDVISAWFTRLVVQQMESPSSERTIEIMNAFGLRSVLAKDLLPSDYAYVANAVLGVYALVSAKDILTKPLGIVAAAVRRSIVEQGTREQLEARRVIDLASMEKTGSPSLFGDGQMKLIIFSNWTKARFFENDFSAAVVKRSTTKEAMGRSPSKIGRPCYIQTAGYTTSTFPLRNAFPVIGKDNDGNFWISGTLRKGFWSRIEEVLNRSE